MEDESAKVVYVGHLPFDMTEEQIKDIFKTAGPVKQIRLVFDRATGKSKGFAFVQYYKPESAQSAVRNLDKYKVGNMNLRVNFSSGKFFNKKPQKQSDDPQTQDEVSGVVPDIVDFVSSVPVPQKQQLLVELKQLIAEKPALAKNMLELNPQVTYAIVQTMFELGRIDGPAAQSLIKDGDRPDEDTRSHTPSAAPMPATAAAPPPQAPAPPQPKKRAITPISEEQKNIYRQIMMLTPEQMNAMPAEQQHAAMQIRAQIMSGEIAL